MWLGTAMLVLMLANCPKHSLQQIFYFIIFWHFYSIEIEFLLFVKCKVCQFSKKAQSADGIGKCQQSVGIQFPMPKDKAKVVSLGREGGVYGWPNVVGGKHRLAKRAGEEDSNVFEKLRINRIWWGEGGGEWSVPWGGGRKTANREGGHKGYNDL